MSTSKALAELIAGMPAAAVDALATALETGRVKLSSSSVGLSHVRGLGQENASRAARTFAAVREDIDEQTVVASLRVGNRLRSIERLSRPELEIAWTGPEAEGPLVRSTTEVIEEMLEAVRDTGEVLLVGYSLTAARGSFMEQVVDLLVDATRRRAAVTVVLHQDEEEENLSNLMDIWDVFTKKPRVYTWRPRDKHPYTKLHAKCLVVDRLDALVTSANFTFLGLESNLELGLRVRGPQAAAIAERFDHLIASEVLEPWKIAPSSSLTR